MSKNDLFGIYGMYHVPFWQKTAFRLGIGAVCVLFAMGIAFRIYKRRRMRMQVRSSWTYALDRLHELHSSELFSSEYAYQFYSRLTVIVKAYIQQRYGDIVTSKTDAEFIGYMKKQTYSDPSMISDLQEIFTGVEAIKFAGKTAVSQKMDDDIARAIALVTRTIPQSQ